MTRVAIAYPTVDRLLVRMKYDRGTPAARLARAYVVEPDGCWRWVKGITTSGYGHLSVGAVQYQAHRLLYILEFGHDVPAGLFLDHLCRHRWCVNPHHLEPVTHAVNVQRGTQAHLTPEQVDEIRLACRNGASQRKLAPLYGIDHSQISKIVNGLSWADRPFPVETVAA